MCRDTLSVQYDGTLFDCDFNQQLGIGLSVPKKRTIFDISKTEDVENSRIQTGPHCFGCTAGSGSSCQGEVV